MSERPQTANLLPFDSTEEGRQKARENGRKGGLKRAENARKRKALEAKDAESLQRVMADLTTHFNREELADQAAAVASMLLSRVASGDIEINGRDVSGLLDTLVTIVRLEEGKATSHVATLSMDGADVLDRIQMLREQSGNSYMLES